MSRFRLKLSLDNEPVVKVCAEKFSELETVFDDLKRKFGERKGRK